MKKISFKFFIFLAFILCGSQAVISQESLTITKDDIYIVQGDENGPSKNGEGMHLYIRKKSGINSVMLVESSSTKDVTNYAYRATEYNKINGDEIRILDGKVLESEYAKYSLISSTVEKNEKFGEAFHIYIPKIVVYGYPWARSGTIDTEEGLLVNIRSFGAKYCDYSNGFKDNNFMISKSKQKKSDKKVTEQKQTKKEEKIAIPQVNNEPEFITEPEEVKKPVTKKTEKKSIVDDVLELPPEPSVEDEILEDKTAEIERARKEAERLAQEETARIEAEKLAQEEAARAEAEKLAQEEAARIEAEKLAQEEAARIEAEKLAQEEAARAEAERLAQEEAARAEAERLAQEEAARAEAEKLAQEEAARIEAEKLAQEEAARIEAEKLAQEEAARIEAEKLAQEEAARAEAEKLAQEEAARIEAEKLAQEDAARAEAERLAQEEAERTEAERIAQEEAARIEAERLAQEEAARAEAEKLAQEESSNTESENLDESNETFGIEYAFVKGKGSIKDLYISTTEITQGSYRSIMDKNDSHNRGTNYPVDSISFYDAIVFCNTLSIKSGLEPCYTIQGSTNPEDWGEVPLENNNNWNKVKVNNKANGYRLLTKDEWEYAAKGGINKEKTKYSGSKDIGTVGWYLKNTDLKSSAVSKKKENSLGLYDMTGNLWEWVWGISGKNGTQKGGSYSSNEASCTIDYSEACQLWSRRFENGLRICRLAVE
ncbi:MAG: SUMF1/EgtB/PvdO family nonheme iron enzyme [Spirochaetales bacterium]|nr:SUMF1/EgtB/PvdO family nonheme iron enzyme [Spirochaetales bacterium]